MVKSYVLAIPLALFMLLALTVTNTKAYVEVNSSVGAYSSVKSITKPLKIGLSCQNSYYSDENVDQVTFKYSAKLKNTSTITHTDSFFQVEYLHKFLMLI